MNLFRETRYPSAAPLEYKGIKLFEVEDERFFDSPLCYWPAQITPIRTAWNPSERSETRLQAKEAQAALDREWALIDAASEGDPHAIRHVKFTYDRMSGRQKPTNRVIEPVKIRVGNPFKWITTCRQCGCKMAASNQKIMYCTAACTRAAHRRAVAKINAKRPKVQQSPKCCQHCNELFIPKRADAKFCAGRCRIANMRTMNHA